MNSKKSINVGFIGNPNCGKTTLFNAFTGANLKVANWPGVTVEKKEGTTYYQGQEFRLIDLPGIYSLTSYSMEETVSRECIMSDEVDVIVDVIDASSLERNLYLTLQLLELGKPVVLALNMMDIVEERGMELDLHRLPEMLGVPAIPVSARKKSGLSILMHAVAHHSEMQAQGPLIHHHPGLHSSHRHDHHSEYAMVYTDEIEDKIDAIIVRLKEPIRIWKINAGTPSNTWRRTRASQASIPLTLPALRTAVMKKKSSIRNMILSKKSSARFWSTNPRKPLLQTGSIIS